MKEMTAIEWYEYGLRNKWITRPYCQTHDGGWEHLTAEEMQDFEDGGDPCVVVCRVNQDNFAITETYPTTE